MPALYEPREAFRYGDGRVSAGDMVRASNGDCVADSGGVGNGAGEGAARELKSRQSGRCIYVLGREAIRRKTKERAAC
jgi:hypothetical protein